MRASTRAIGLRREPQPPIPTVIPLSTEAATCPAVITLPVT
ncbi:hypothetical protein ACFQ0B_72815 [Nonomuraea thailandensis]